MNKLHQKIFDELDRFEKFSQYITKQDAARIAASICLEVVYEGYCHGRSDCANYHTGVANGSFEDFKKEIL